jgi:pimeloyl-ACP methyl ester carboxylesterase
MKHQVTVKELSTPRIMCSVLPIIAMMLGIGKDLIAQTNAPAVVKNLVLVHGGFVHGSGWEGVYKALKKNGYAVAIVQNPTTSLADNVAVTKRAIAAQNSPVILVGHSYGRVVVTEAGNDPKVAGLVYITAFAPHKAESVSSLTKDPPSGRACSANPAAAGWIPISRLNEVPGGIRRRRESRHGLFHGRLSSALGPRGTQWCNR